MQIVSKYKKPTSQIYFEDYFQTLNLDWTRIYLLPRLVTLDSVLRAFQFKILHNVLFLNKKLFLFHKVPSPLCSFCNKEEETILHTFNFCPVTVNLWKDLKISIRTRYNTSSETPL